MAEPVFVQPHFDDVALSCGGTVAALAEDGRLRVVTIFAGMPETEMSDFARFQHERWEIEDGDVIAMRRTEDRNAAAILGETVDVIWLDHLDAIYRRVEYGSEDALFGVPVDADMELADQVAGELNELGDVFIMPMGVGNHVDHQLAFLAGGKLDEFGNAVWLYADLPYALDERAFRSRLEALGNPDPCIRTLTPGQFERRWNAIECYGSQLPVIFRDLPESREQFRRFGNPVRDDNSVELFWRMADIEEGGL